MSDISRFDLTGLDQALSPHGLKHLQKQAQWAGALAGDMEKAHGAVCAKFESALDVLEDLEDLTHDDRATLRAHLSQGLEGHAAAELSWHVRQIENNAAHRLISKARLAQDHHRKALENEKLAHVQRLAMADLRTKEGDHTHAIATLTRLADDWDMAAEAHRVAFRDIRDELAAHPDPVTP